MGAVLSSDVAGRVMILVVNSRESAVLDLRKYAGVIDAHVPNTDDSRPKNAHSETPCKVMSASAAA
jgi:hypothetical protein